MLRETLSLVCALHLMLLVQLSSEAGGTTLQYAGNLRGTPSNMIVSTDRVYISVKNVGLVLNLTLSASGQQQFTDSIHRDSDIAAMIKVPGHNMIIVCLYDESCHAVWPLPSHHNQFYASSHLEEISFPKGSTLLGEQSEAYSSVYLGGTRVDSNGSKWIQLEIIHIKPSKVEVKTSTQLIVSVKISANEFISRDFISNFYYGDYCYFIARDNFVNSSVIRVVRVNQRNDASSDPIVEVQVHCNADGKNFTIVSQSRMNQTIILGLNQAGSSTLCTFTVADIDRVISSTLSKCTTGNYLFSLPWSYMLSSCSNFTKLSNIGVIASSISVMGSNLLTFTGGEEITAVTVVGINQTHYYLYVANSNLNHVVVKYLIQDGTTLIKVQSAVKLSHPALLMRQGSAMVYVATAKQVMGFEVNACDKHTSCLACVTSGDPICGWCATEGKCSRYSKCRLENEMGYSAQGSILQCFSEKSQVISESSLAMDNLHSLRLVTSVVALPLLFKEYNILCTSVDHKFVVQGFLSGSDIYCNFTNSGISFTMQNKAEALVKFDILLKLDNETATFSNVAVHFHNCSMHFRCGECELVPVCGWCVYKNKCTGSSLHCLLKRNWIHKQGQGSTSVCPAVLPAESGRYVLPVGVSTNVSLLTRNIPPPSHGTRFLCKLQYSNGDFIYTSATYNNSFQVHCQIGTGQVVISKAAQDKGMEHLNLTLWIKGSSGILHQIDHLPSTAGDEMNGDQLVGSSLSNSPPPKPRSVRMAVFNCSYYSESCSLCMTENNPDFLCVWCLSGQQATCAALQSCSSSTNEISFINSSKRCYNDPIIKSVFPSSGPTAGGTLVAITGTDLGVNANEIEVMFGNSSCSIIHNSYQPARKIFCRTGLAASIGPASIVVTVKRNTPTYFHFTSIFAEGVTDSFTYDTPYLHSIEPAYGPLSGGTLMVLHGSALNVSNTDLTSVSTAGSICNILNISYYKIFCETSAVQYAVGSPVRLTIDHAYLQVKNFTYMENPEFHSLQPQHTIPAGGIILRITGNYLNVSAQPMLVIFIGNTSYSNICTAVSRELLLCPVPRLPLPQSQISSSTLPQQQRNKVILNYRIVMDGAPGPNISNQSLSLTLREDPIFFEFDDDKQYKVFSEESISIMGRNLDSVHFSEINVTLLEEPCRIIVVTAKELICKPPDFPIRNDRDIEVKVSVANGSLIFKVGSLKYIKASTEMLIAGETPFSSMIFVVIISCVGLSLVILLIGLIIAVSIVAIKRHHRILKKVQPKIELEDTKAESLEKSNSENWYEVISDSLVQSGHLFLEPNCSIVNQPTHVRTNGAFPEVNRCASKQLPAANPLGRPFICNEGNQFPPHLGEEYVKMCSHQICSNLSITTNIDNDKRHTASDQSIADYMDMQQVEQRPNHSITADPSCHKNVEIVL